MTWNKWLVFTKISYYVIEQHIKLTLPVWRCSITVSIIWPYLTPPLDMQNFGVEVCLSLHVPYDPGSIPTDNFVVLVVFFIATMFCIFCSLLPQWIIFLYFFHIGILIKKFKSQFNQFMRCSEDCNACKNWWYLFIVLLREITQNTTDRNIANFSAICWKSTRIRCLFLFFRLTIVFHGFYIWNLNRKYTLKILLQKRYFCPYETMAKVPCSVISESWKISKILLVTIAKVTMKFHNVQIKCIISNLKEIYPKTECIGSVLNC